jgi:hypothetical protein
MGQKGSRDIREIGEEAIRDGSDMEENLIIHKNSNHAVLAI